jgi:signal peptidase I
MNNLVRYFAVAALVLLMSIAVLVFLAPRFNWRVDTVFSGSMQPALKVGSIVITQPVDVKDIKAGDIITFRSPPGNELMSHRVTSVEGNSPLYFRTKGDANEDNDPLIVTAENIVGRICFHLPYFGYVARFVRTPPGLLLTLGFPGLAIIVLEMMKIRRVLIGRKIS